MCGIIGIVSTIPVRAREWVRVGRDAMRHRGPDDAGLWWSCDGRVGFGHRRLAIIDLSPAGHQPMASLDGGCIIAFNGEIYNHFVLRAELTLLGHSFRSHSDTEVILAAYRQWGNDCLARLDGMFAFAIYDAHRRIVLLARDRAGEKPLFVSLRNQELRFSSELKGLLADPTLSRRIDKVALDLYLSMGYAQGSYCAIEGISKLPPAHALSFNMETGKHETWSYWSIPATTSFSAHASVEDLAQELDALLEKVVRAQMVADVPVGVLLSGGIDSSLVTAMAARSSSRIKTFTVGFEGHASFDERSHAHMIADYFGTEHIELDAGTISVDLLPILARQYDDPVVDSSMLPTYLLSRMVRQHCTVALGGDGGDELFGGYLHYSRMLGSSRAIRYLPRPIGWLISKLATRLMPQGIPGRQWLRTLSCDINRGIPIAASLFDNLSRAALLANQHSRLIGSSAEAIWLGRIPNGSDLLDRVTRMDFNNYLPEDILVKVDRASMLNSLEIRTPLLDRTIIEFAFSRVPTRLKATPKERKILLKQLAVNLLPPNFDLQRKQGFSIPLAQWLKSGDWRNFFREILFDSQCLFNSKVISDLFRGQEKGRNNSERLFGLVMFELWRREYKISL